MTNERATNEGGSPNSAGGGLKTKPQLPYSAAEKVAVVLRQEILDLPEGSHLGLEDELLLRFQISRPTWRQSARMLVQEQLLTVRRGVGGGYYTARPQIESVSDVAATYLALAEADMFHLLAAGHALMSEGLRAAARNGDAGGHRRLRAIVDSMRLATEKPAAGQLEDDDELMSALLALAGNPAIDLFLRVIYSFGARETNLRIFSRHPERMARWRAERVELGDAVLAGDADLALALAISQSKLIESWVREDIRIGTRQPGGVFPFRSPASP